MNMDSRRTLIFLGIFIFFLCLVFLSACENNTPPISHYYVDNAYCKKACIDSTVENLHNGGGFLSGGSSTNNPFSSIVSYCEEFVKGKQCAHATLKTSRYMTWKKKGLGLLD